MFVCVQYGGVLCFHADVNITHILFNLDLMLLPDQI